MSHYSIILIENDVHLRQSLALILQRAGYSITSTDCVDTALARLKSGEYDLFISDINLTETNKVLIPKVRDVDPHLPLLILSDQSSDEVEGANRQLNVHYLIKPVAPEQLLDSVHSLLGHNNSAPRHNDLLFEEHI